jgi:hypothetical protein
MNFYYKVIVVTSLIFAIECCFWGMYDTQSLQEANSRIQEQNRQIEILLKMIEIYKEK